MKSTIAYVQRIRVERAKRALETGGKPIEEISWAVGYEDPASFRRLFKRVTGSRQYRRRFQLPDLPHVRAEAACGRLKSIRITQRVHVRQDPRVGRGPARYWAGDVGRERRSVALALCTVGTWRLHLDGVGAPRHRVGVRDWDRKRALEAVGLRE